MNKAQRPRAFVTSSMESDRLDRIEDLSVCVPESWEFGRFTLGNLLNIPGLLLSNDPFTLPAVVSLMDAGIRVGAAD